MADATQLGITLGNTLTFIANAKNVAAIKLYQENIRVNPAFAVPDLELVNKDQVTALEVQYDTLLRTGKGEAADVLDWTSVYTYIPYDPTPAPVVPPPVVVTETGSGRWVQTPFGKEWVPTE